MKNKSICLKIFAGILSTAILASSVHITAKADTPDKSTFTAEQFNQKFGTSLEMGVTLFEIFTGGMANGSPRALRLTSGVGDPTDFIAYNMTTEDDTHADKSIKYLLDSSTMTSTITSNQSTPNPGSVSDSEKPEGALLNTPNAVPTVTNMTEPTFEAQNGLTFKVQATADNTAIKAVSLSYKDNTSPNFETYNLTRGKEADTFTKTIAAIDLTGKKSYEYYFEVSDGFQTVRTNTQTITSLDPPQEGIQINVSENDVLSGRQDIITTGDTLLLDENTLENGVDSIEKPAKFVFDVSQTDTFFKNAVAIGSEVLHIFDEGTYSEWATITVDVNPAYFVKGKQLQIDIHAGNKANALEHNEENNDDFVLKNIRLIMPDGTSLRAKGYENADTTVNMGDSSGKTEILNAIFIPREETFNSLRYDLDTTNISDGSHVFRAQKAAASKEVSFQVDNTPPQIQTNMEEIQYKGSVTIEAEATDVISGVESLVATLDGKTITLPHSFRTLEVTPGEHLLELQAKDKKGNTSEKSLRFTTAQENAEIGMEIEPKPGSTVFEDPTFSLEVTDTTSDLMNVAFKYGERYVLGDENIAVDKGLSNEAGVAANIFSDTDVNGFPYETFQVPIDGDVNENAKVRVDWTGASNNAKTKMYVYNVVSQMWDNVSTETSPQKEGMNLSGIIPLKEHVSDQKIKLMIQVGEGYTPTQYTPGTPASSPLFDTTPISNENDLDRTTYDFTFAIESDTQYYNEDTPDNPGAIGKYQTQLTMNDWLVANRSRMNIQYMFHNGDIIDDEPMVSQWENADKAYQLLDNADFPYGVLAGNHDVGQMSEDYNSYGTYFGEQRYQNNPWYGKSLKNNKGHYDLITVGGIDFIMVYMGWGIGDEEIDWMNQVLAQYPERKAILNFHEYLLASGGLGEIPQRIYDNVVSPNPNVSIVLSRHYHNAKTMVKDFDDNKDGVNDRKVYEMLFDYQGLPEGGLGYLRLMHFDMDSQQIYFRTYSPTLNDYNAKDTVPGAQDSIAGEEEFTIPLADLGIIPNKKTLTTTSLDVNVYDDKTFGEVSGVKSGTRAEFTLKNAPQGSMGWYGEVTDEFGGLSRTNVNYVTVQKDTTKPVISFPLDTVLSVGDPFDPLSDVAAMDKEDGDLTAKLLVMGAVDTEKAGQYTLTYQVSDRAGNVATLQRVILVKEKGVNAENLHIVEMIQNTPEGETVSMKAAGENPVISEAILQSAAGRDINLVMTTDKGIQITLNGKDIQNISAFGARIDLEKEDRKLYVQFVNALALPGKLLVEFTEDNVLGLDRPEVKTQLAVKGNGPIGKASGTLSKSGRVDIAYETDQPVTAELSYSKNTSQKSPRTGDNTSLAALAILGVLSGSAVIILKKKR